MILSETTRTVCASKRRLESNWRNWIFPVDKTELAIIQRPSWFVSVGRPDGACFTENWIFLILDFSRKICGSLEYYDKTNDRLSTKNTKKLSRVNRVYHKVTTTDDPIIRQLAKTDGNVFATESIITTLMCCSRSVYPWDIVVSVNQKFFKRSSPPFPTISQIFNFFNSRYCRKSETNFFLIFEMARILTCWP